MAGVGLIMGLVLHVANVLHDFMLSLSGDVVAGVDHFQIPPERIFLDLFADKVLDAVGYLFHEFSSGGDAIGIKDSLIFQLIGCRGGRRRLAPVLGGGSFGHILGRSKAPGSLLVELGSGGHAVDGHEHGYFGFDDLSNDAIEVVHDAEHHVLFGQDVGDIQMIRVRTAVDDSVHVEVEVVEFWQ